MKLAERDEHFVVGYTVRTDNTAEADPKQARLPDLWRRATAPDAFAAVEGRLDDRMYAVLTDYESDHHGAYTEVVGVAVADLGRIPEGFVGVRVPAAQCLLVPVRGPIPQALVEAWQGVWQYTESGDTPARSFATDLEIYHEDGADLFLSVA